MSPSNWHNWLKSIQAAGRHARRDLRAAGGPGKRGRSDRRPLLEVLEDRVAPALHVWQGGAGGLWSVPGNWQNNSQPVAGEASPVIVQFPGTGGSTSTDNIPNLVVDQIHFTSGGNTISGATTLGISGNVLATNVQNDAGDNIIDSPITLSAGNNVSVLTTAGSVTINGVISGNSGISLLPGSAAGTLTLTGDNTFTNPVGVFVDDGTLQLNSNGLNTAIPNGNVFVGDGNGAAGSAVLRLLQSDQINDGAFVAVGSDGLFDLGDHLDTINILFISSGGQVSTSPTGTVFPTGTLAFNGDAGNDTLDITATASSDGNASFQGAAPFNFGSVGTLSFSGAGGANVLTINNPAGGLFAPAGGINFSNFGGGGATLNDLGGGDAATDDGVYTPTDGTPGSGTLTHTEGAAVQTISFTGLSPATDTVAGATFTINGTSAAEHINIVDGPVAGQTQVNSDPDGTFELINVANKTTVTVNGIDGADTFTVNNPTPAAGLTTLNVNAGATVTTTNVLATPSTVITNIVGNNFGDTVNVGDAGTVGGILGTLNIENPPQASSIVVDDSADTTARTVTFSTFTPSVDVDHPGGGNIHPYGKISGLAPADINYEYDDLNSLTVDAGSGGNTFNVDSTSNFGATTAINGGTGDDTFNINASNLGSGSTNNFNGQDGNDVFNVTGALPDTSTTLNIDGGTSGAVPPGNTLNVPDGDTVTPTGPNSGEVGTSPATPNDVVTSYSNIQSVNSVSPPAGQFDVVISTTALGTGNDGGADAVRLVLVNGGTTLDVFLDSNGGGEVLVEQFDYAAVRSITVDGSNDQDTLTVDNSGGLINRAIRFDGVAPGNGNTLVISGGTQVARETFFANSGDPTAGTEVLDPTDAFGAGAVGATAPTAQIITFVNLSPVFSDTPAAIYDVILSTNADDASIINTALATPPGFTAPSMEVKSNNGTFESHVFANKTDVRVMGYNGADTITLDYTTAAAGLNTLDVYGYLAPDVAAQPGFAADDNAPKIFFVDATAAGTANNLFGNGGNDDFENLNLTIDMTAIQGPVNITGGTANNDVAFSDDGSATAFTATLTSNLLTSTAWANISYTGIQNFFFEGSSADDTIDILSTAAGATYTLGGDGGSDTITVGNTTANFQANTYNGTLANILGPINIIPDLFNPAGAANVLNVDASGDASLAGSASITNVGVVTYPAFLNSAGFTLSSPTTTLHNFAPADISYAHGDITPNFNAVQTSRLQFLNVRASRGNDDITVNDTTATDTTTVQGLGGNDTFTINADNLSGGNDFQGDDNAGISTPGNDTFNLNITSDIGASAVYQPTTSLTIEGDNPAANSVNRDVLHVVDANANGHFLNFAYQSQTSGNMVVTGFAIPITINTMETVTSANTAGNNDTASVTGTAGDDEITVAPLSQNSALVFLGTEAKGGGWENDPGEASFFSTLPGVAGGATGPDLLLQNLARFSVLTVNGGGSTLGDQLYVDAPNENSLIDPAEQAVGADPFGFGPGVLLPGVGPHVFNRIDVNNSFTPNEVDITNGALGSLIPVQIASAGDFMQFRPGDPNEAGLVVNAGDEPSFNPTVDGPIADNITAAASNFNIRINGQAPPLPGSSQPLGDQLNLFFNGDANVWSDNNVVPNVTVQDSANALGTGITFSSIERTVFDVGNTGVVNIIGDDNNPAVDQNDVYKVVGEAIPVFPSSTPANGFEAFSLQIGGDKNLATGHVDLSPKIYFTSVEHINAYGGSVFVGSGNDFALPEGFPGNAGGTGIDSLAVTPYANNEPDNWGIETNWYEGDPVADGDLLTFNAVPGVSNAITIAPSGARFGQVADVNAATNTPIAVVKYLLDTNIIVNGQTGGNQGNTDTLTLLGTNPDTPDASGNDDFLADFTAAGGPSTPMVRAYDAGAPRTVVGPSAAERADTAGTDPTLTHLYNLQSFSNFNTINFGLLGGSDVFDLLAGRKDGSLTVNVDGGNDPFTDLAIVTGTAGGPDVFTVQPGAAPNSVTVLVHRTGSGVNPTRLNLSNMAQLQVDGGGGSGQDSLAVGGTPANDNFAVSPTDALDGTISMNNFLTLIYTNLGTAASQIVLFGGGGNDSVSVVGSSGADTYTYEPIASNDANLGLTDSAGNSVTFSFGAFTALSLDASIPATGTPADTLKVAVTNAVLTPGPVSGSARVTPTNAGGQGLLPLDYTNVESTVITGGTVVVEGTPGNDVITVGATGIVTVADNNGLVQQSYDLSGVNAVVIDALAGDDSVSITSSGLFAGGITVLGGEPGSGSDSLTIDTTAASPNATVNFSTNQVTGVVGGPIALSGIESLIVNGLDGILNAFTVLGFGAVTDVVNLLLNGGDTNNNDGDTIDVTAAGGPATLRYTPLSASTARLERLEGGPVLNVTGFNSADNGFSLTGGGSIKALDVVGPAGNDLVGVTAGGLGTRVTVTANGGGGGGVKWVPVDFVGVAGLAIDAGAGNDRIDIDNSGGLIALPSGITVDGNTGSDVLRLIGTTAVTSDTYTPGPDAGSGRIVQSTAAATQSVSFTNLEPVIDLVSGPLAVNGTAASNAITYSAGPNSGLTNVNNPTGLTTGQVTVDNFESIEFANKTTLTINAVAGNNVVTINDATTPAGLTGITVNGTGSNNQLIVDGTAAADAIGFAPTGADAGSVSIAGLPTVTFTSTQSVAINGEGGGDTLTVTTPASTTTTLTPGAAVDSGTVQAGSLTPLSYSNLGAGSVTVADAGGTLIYNGTAGNDTFTVAAGAVTLNSQLPVTPTGLSNLTLAGQGGANVFNLTGTLPFTSTAVDGNGSDTLNLTGASGAVTINLGAGTVTGYGGTISYQGITSITAGAGGNALTVAGSAGPDAFTVTPLTASSARVSLAGAFPVVTATTTGAFTIDGLGGSNTLDVLGTSAADTITVSGTAVTVNALQTVHYANIAGLNVQGLDGNDSFTVTPSATVNISVDGGDPIGSTAGDQLTISSGGAAVTFNPGPLSDEGSFLVAGDLPVSFTNIELLSTGGSSVVLNGTNGNDTFTVIARDSSTNAGADGVQDFTVSVNGGPDVLFLNTAAVTLNGLSGDDTYYVVAPAPNDAVWNVQVTINGGPASANNRVFVSTPVAGTEAVTYTPSSRTSGTLNLATLTSPITMSGVEQLNYQGNADPGNTLTVAASNASTIVPGTNPGDGLVEPVGANGHALLNLTYTNVGGAVTLTGSTLQVQGTSANDTISVSATGIVTVTNPLGFVNSVDASAFTALVINGMGGDDTISIAASALFPSGITIIGNDGSTTLSVTATGAVGVNFTTNTVTGVVGGPIAFSNVQTINVSAGANAVTVTGTAGPDAVSVTPTGASTATVTLAGLVVNTTNTGTLTIDGGAGSNTVTVNGTAGDDTITVTKGATTTVGVNALQKVSLPSATDNTVIIAAGHGNDTINVSGTTSNAQILNVQGGDPTALDPNSSDTLSITMSTAGLTDVNQGTTVAEGVVFSRDGATEFSGIELVVLTGTAAGANTVQAEGTDSNDTITLSNDGGGNEFYVNSSVILFSNYQTANISGNFGDDQIKVAPTGLVGVTTVNVSGSLTSVDALRVFGGTGANVVAYNPAGSAGDPSPNVLITGAPVVNFNTTDQAVTSVTYEGTAGGDKLTVNTPAGSTTTYSPGSTPDSGSVQVNSLVPLTFTNLGVAAVPQVVTVAAAAGATPSTLIYNGTPGNDTFTVSSVIGLNFTGVPQLPVMPTGITTLTLNGLAGDNTFNITTPEPAGVTTINVNGSGLPDPDVVNLTGNATAATVSMGTATPSVSQPGAGGLGTVNIAGVGTVNLTNGAGAITVTGTAGPDSITVTPNGADTATIQASEVNPVLNTTNTGTLTIDPSGGNDTVTVNGTSFDDAITIAGGPTATVAVNALKVITVSEVNTEGLVVNGGLGDDTFTVDSSAAPVSAALTVDGGGGGSDTLKLTGGTADSDTYTPGPGTGQGNSTLVFAGVIEDVTFVNLTPVVDLVGGPLVVNDTNTADAIDYGLGANSGTILAGRVFTAQVSFNSLETIEFANKPTLTINALGGSDTVSINSVHAPTGMTLSNTAAGVIVNGGTPLPAAVPGDVLSVQPLDAQLTITQPKQPSGWTGFWTFSDGNDTPRVDFTGIETLHPTADLSITMRVLPVARIEGGLITYTIIVTNNGDDDATNVVLTDKVPNLMQFVSSTFIHPYNDKLGELNLDTIPAHETVSGSITFRLLEEGTVSNTASVRSGLQDPDSTNNTAFVGSLIVPDAQITAQGGLSFNAVVGTPTRLLTLASFQDPGGPGEVEYKAVIDWGDGKTTVATLANAGIVNQGTVNGIPSFAVQAKHSYLSAGDFTITVTIFHAHLPGVEVVDNMAVSGNAVIVGTPGNDRLLLKSGGAVGTIIYKLNSLPPVTLTNVSSFTFNGGNGNDTMTVDFSAGVELVTGEVLFVGGLGQKDQLVMDAAGQVIRTLPGHALSVKIVRSHYHHPATIPNQTLRYLGTEGILFNDAAAVNNIAGPDTADRHSALMHQTAQSRFVQVVYLDELGRPGSKAELNKWVGALNHGATRQSVITAIQDSAEGRAHLVQAWYQTFLGRAAMHNEESTWVGNLEAQQKINPQFAEEIVLSKFLSEPAQLEYFRRSQTLIHSGNTVERYIAALYQVLLNRPAGADEVKGWELQVHKIGLQGVALGILRSTEFRTDAIEGLFNALVHRPATVRELVDDVFSNMDLQSIRTQVEASDEFFKNG